MSQLAHGSRPVTRPAPVMGWNVLDPIALMEEGYAVRLDNMIPRQRYVELRRGHTEHADIGSVAVESLFAFRGASSEKLLAFGGTTVYDVSETDTATSLGTGLDEEAIQHWQGTNFNGRGIMVNGVDAPRSYDGSTVTAAGFTGTGLTPSNLFAVTPFKRRLMFLDKTSSDIWYGDINAITGTLTRFPLATVHPEGGRPVAIGTLTMDGGQGIDDRLAVFMESGDVLIYEGDDINDAGRFGLVGIFQVGRTIGRRPLIKLGADLIAITSDGFIPLIQFVRDGRSRTDMAISNRIAGAVRDAVREYRDTDGWQAVLYPAGTYVIFNIPSTPAVQYVMNTQTGAWCRFQGMDANCWALYDDRLFFGSGAGKVYEADDDTSQMMVDGVAQGAFSTLGYQGNKLLTMFKPVIQATSSVQYRAGFVMDFDGAPQLETVPGVGGDTAMWGTAKWGTFKWGGGLVIHDEWQQTGSYGRWMAERVEVETAREFRWLSTDIVARRAGAL